MTFFPKRFLSWGFKTLFASASSCQCKPPHFRRRLGYVRWISISRDPRGAQDFDWVALPGAIARNSLAPTRPYHPFPLWKTIISHFSKRKWAKTRFVSISQWKIDHFLNSRGRDAILATQRIPRGRDSILSTQRIRRGRELILPTQRIPRGRDRILSTQRIS